MEALSLVQHRLNTRKNTGRSEIGLDLVIETELDLDIEDQAVKIHGRIDGALAAAAEHTLHNHNLVLADLLSVCLECCLVIATIHTLYQDSREINAL